MFKKVFNSEIKGIDEKEMTITALISTNGRDRSNEVLEAKGADLTNYRKNPVVLWAHDYETPPIGKALWVKRGPNGVLSKVKFASTEFAKEIFGLYKEGFLNAFSVGFIPKEMEDGDGEKKPMTTFKTWELLEFSAVPVPANPEALSLAMQKGILTKSVKEQLEKEIEVISDEEEVVKEEPKEEEVVKEEESDEKAFEDILGEIKQLQEEICYLRKENTDLRYDLYKTYVKSQEGLSEIAVNNFAGKAVEIMDGVIRKATGKV